MVYLTTETTNTHMSNNNTMSSSTMGDLPSTMGQTSGQQTTIFHDSESSDVASILNSPDSSFMDGGQMSVSLTDYLKRPVMMPIGGGGIYHVDWPVTTGHVGREVFRFDPWQMWKNTPAIAAKIKNFAYFRGKLHLKFKIQSTQFHYGMMRITYDPFGNTNTIISRYSTNTSLIAIADEGAAMHHSSMMGAELSACDAQGVEMILPYVNFKNWLEIPVSWDTSTYEQTNELGTIMAHEIAPLRTTSVSSVNVRITAFAWMEDAVLSTPTVYTAAGGEMPVSPGVSDVASAVAAASGKLSRAPIIGKFAKATSMASSTVGNIAALFGFSKPPDIAPLEKARLFTTGDAVTTNGTFEGHRLVLDSRQELNIDPRTVGLGGTDEMGFDFICKKECWLTSAYWGSNPSSGQITFATGDYSDVNLSQLIFHINVTPYIGKLIGNPNHLVNDNQVVDTTCDVVVPTPAAFIARAFDFWRGVMVYRFRVIASGFHKGSLRIAYDPLYPQPSLAAAYDESGLNQMSEILDLDEAREIIFKVPWSSQYPYLQVGPQVHYLKHQFCPNARDSFNNDARGNFTSAYHNGVVTVQIVNPLISPNEEPVNLVVSSWMEECEFQGPSERIRSTYPEYQSAAALVDTSSSDTMSSTCFGERIVSIRSLMKRSTLAYALATGTSGGSTTTAAIVLPQFPVSGQFIFTANQRSIKVSYLTYFSNAYMGRRGGVRYMIRPVTNTSAPVMAAGQSWQATRKWDAYSPGTSSMTEIYGVANQGYTFTIPSLATSINSATASQVMQMFDPGYEGTVQAMTDQEPFAVFEVPHYGVNRFSLARFNQNFGTLGASDNTYNMIENPAELGFQYFTFLFTGQSTGNRSFMIYASAAEDLTFFWFQAPPPWYTQTAG